MSEPAAAVTPCNNAALRQATRRMGQLYDDAVAPSGLRATQHGILATVQMLESPTMGQLAQTLVMDLSGLGHTLKPLTRDGYLAIQPDPHDKRARRIVLTALGRGKLAQTTRLWRRAQDRFEAAFGVERAAELRGVLSLLTAPDFERAFLGALPSGPPESQSSASGSVVGEG